jgi:hypothetical protein
MAGIAIVLDVLRKNPSLYTGQSLHSYGLFSATAAAAAAAAAISAGTPFASRALFGYSLSLSLSTNMCVCVCARVCVCAVDGSFNWVITFGLLICGLGMDWFEFNGHGQLVSWLLFFEYGSYRIGLVVLLDWV